MTTGDGTSGTESDVLAEARAWAAQDPDDVTRSELETLIERTERGDDHAPRDLAARFDGRLEFGTAGLRGELGAGPTRMNRVLVAQAAGGLAAYLLERAPHPSVVVGYDARHNSQRFAEDTAEILAGAGVRAILLPRLLPTPVLAFAVRRLGTSAGVMVTASHNPARDNGYKVYLGHADAGSQIVPPADAEIQAHILRVAEGSIALIPRSDGWELAPESVISDYIDATAAVATRPGSLPFAYTAMHGVGWETASRVFAAAGFATPVVVAEQRDPDPDFPTVPFPNPEEPGAMDLAFATAARSGVELVIANDPDADRLAVGIPTPGTVEGWRRLTGNEAGTLLGWREARRRHAEGRAGTLACSIVSSPALGRIARRYGLAHVETLTGFKWISRAPDLVFGYEEALGYLVDPDVIRDKDGISAAVAFLDLATELRAEGSGIPDALERVAEEVGGWASGQISVRVADLAEIPATMARLRDAPPRDLAGREILRVDDFAAGVAGFPPSDVLRFALAEDARVIVRPSGTEPKLKVYLDAVSEDGSGAERLAAAARIVAELDDALNALLS